MDFPSRFRSKVSPPADPPPAVHLFCTLVSLRFEKVLIAILVTHRYWVVDGVLHCSSQALLHHAGERVELMLLVDFKHTQELPALPQTSPDLPLHHPRAVAAAARPCHLHLLRIKRERQSKSKILPIAHMH